MIKCCKCFHHFEDNLSFCAHCGAKIDKAKHEYSLKAKREIIEELEKIIAYLEYHGKLRISCSLVSKILLLTLPGTSFAMAASVGIINRGVSLFTVWKNRRLLTEAGKICKEDLLVEAGKICKEDFDIIEFFLSAGFTTFLAGYKLYRGLSAFFGGGYLGYQNVADTLVDFAEYVPILQDLLALYRGDYSADAKQLKIHLKKLQEEWFPEEHDC